MNKQIVLTIINAVIGALRSVVTSEVVAVLKQALLDFTAHGPWKSGERTDFVFAKVRAAAAATPTVYDDLIVGLLIAAYEAKFKLEGKIPAGQTGPATIPPVAG